jgi:histidinol-phosphatase
VWDLAALDVLVREAGGQLTGLDGAAGPHRGSAVATNGLLHDQVLTSLGSRTGTESV